MPYQKINPLYIKETEKGYNHKTDNLFELLVNIFYGQISDNRLDIFFIIYND